MAKFLTDEEMNALEATQPKKKKKRILSDAEMDALVEGDSTPTSAGPEEDISVVESALGGVRKGITFGFQDEIKGAIEDPEGAVKAIMNKLGSEYPEEETAKYREARDKWRQYEKRLEEANPRAAFAGEVLGGIVTGLIPMGAAAHGAKAGATAAKVATGAKIGAAEGALYGVGESDEESLSKIAKDAAMMAGLGGAFGAALPAGIAAVSKGGKKAAGWAEKRLEKEAQDIFNEAEAVYKSDRGIDIVNRVNKDITENAPREEALFKVVLDNTPAEAVTRKELNQALSADSANFLVEEFQKSLNKTGKKNLSTKEIQQEFAQFVGDEHAKDHMKQFAYWLDKGLLGKGSVFSPESAVQFIKQFKATNGADDLAKRWGEFRRAEIGQKILRETQDQIPRNVTANNALSRLAETILDGRAYAARAIDRRLGTRMTPLMDELGQQNNKFTLTLSAFGKKGDDLAKLAKENNVDLNKIYTALDTGKTGHLAPIEKKAYTSYKNLFDEALTRAQEGGIPIQKRDHYIKHSMVDLPEAIHAIKEKANTVSRNIKKNILTNMDQAEYETLLKTNPEFRELVDGVAYFTQSRPSGNAQEFLEGLRMSVNPSRGRNMWATQANAAFERTAQEVPAFLRETDVNKLYQSWIHNTFRHMYYKDAIAQAKVFRQAAIDAGDSRSLKWLENWIADMSGGSREGTIKRTIRDLGAEARVGMLSYMKDPDVPQYRKNVTKFLYESPEIVSTILNQAYPNLLGASVKSVLTNLMQPIAVTWPELGGRYGLVRVGSAYRDLIAKMTVGQDMVIKNPDIARLLKKKVGDTVKTRNPGMVLLNEGHIPRQWNSEMQGALRSGILDAGLGKMSKKAVDWASEKAMYFYEKSEMINRGIVHEISGKMTDDLMRAFSGEKDSLAQGAMKFFNKVDDSYKDVFREAAAKGKDELRQVVQNYLNAKTIFNYNRASLNEFGRTVGPLVTAFTKWPASVAGDILLEMTKNKPVAEKAKLLAARYLAPWAAFAAIDHFAEWGDSARAKAIVGSGTKRYAAVGSAGSVISGEFLKPPVISAFTDLATGLADGDPEKLYKWLNEALTTFLPGAAYVRLLKSDIPALFQDKKTDGKIIEWVTE